MLTINELYNRYNPLLLKIARGRKFVQILGEEDAYQEACLAFMETVRRIEQEQPEFLLQATFPGYLQNSIINYLIDRTRHEELCQGVEFNEAYLRPCPSFEHCVAEQQYLDELEQFLIDPQIMLLRTDLSIWETKIIYLIFKQELKEKQISKILGIGQPYIAKIKQKALKKLRIYLEKHKF